MKKLLSIVVTLCTLVCAAGFWLVGGSSFMKMQAGPETLGAEEIFSQAEGKYITYAAAYPVASCVEEYYSGDPDRARTTGYVVYDPERQDFLYVVVGEGYTGRLESLMWNLHLAVELRETKDMSPYAVDGTLEPMDENAVNRAISALGESETLELYADIQGDQAYMEAYASDEYGQVMAKLCENLDTVLQQTEWYCIQDTVINGVERMDMWVCVLAAAVSLLIFIIRLLSLFIGGRKKSLSFPAPSGSKMEQFYVSQRDWVEEWCEENLKKGRRYAYLSVIGSVVILVAIGFFVIVPAQPQRLLAFYLPLGVLLGEIIGAMFWYGQKGQSKPEKIFKKFGKKFQKLLPSAEAQEIFAEDILNTGSEWNFSEKTKNGMMNGILGSHYWVALQWNGMVTLVEADKLGKIETETITGTVRSGKVRVSYESHAVRFYYKSATPKKYCDAAISFDVRDHQRYFLSLAKKRTGENVEYMML